MKNAFVTGGAGFMGSALAEKLVENGWQVTVYDDLSIGKRENVPIGSQLVVGDILDREKLGDTLRSSQADVIFHFAAEPDVRKGEADKEKIWKTNVEGTKSVLEACKEAKTVKSVVFASTSTVYGKAKVMPTPEDAPLNPVSEYGKTKKEGEALIQEYCEKNGWNGVIVRFANIIGPKSGHGVIYDFFEKLEKNRRELEVLGDGEQDKSYLYVDDAVRAVLTSMEKGLGKPGETSTYNVGSKDSIKVKELAQIVKKAAGVPDAKSKFAGGTTGWKGDVALMQLDSEKLEKLGWRPWLGAHRAVEKAAEEIAKKKRIKKAGQ